MKLFAFKIVLTWETTERLQVSGTRRRLVTFSCTDLTSLWYQLMSPSWFDTVTCACTYVTVCRMLQWISQATVRWKMWCLTHLVPSYLCYYCNWFLNYHYFLIQLNLLWFMRLQSTLLISCSYSTSDMILIIFLTNPLPYFFSLHFNFLSINHETFRGVLTVESVSHFFFCYEWSHFCHHISQTGCALVSFC
jgi:hypothetical protein